MELFSQYRNASLDRACVESWDAAWANRRQSWGNAVEISGLPRGKLGVTPWKFRRYPGVEFERLQHEIESKMSRNSPHLFSLNLQLLAENGCGLKQNLARRCLYVIYLRA